MLKYMLIIFMCDEVFIWSWNSHMVRMACLGVVRDIRSQAEDFVGIKIYHIFVATRTDSGPRTL